MGGDRCVYMCIDVLVVKVATLPSRSIVFQHTSRLDVWVLYGMIWFHLGWFGLASFGLVWFGLVWLGLVWRGSAWYGLVWFGLVRFG
jgi:hypothetical protein